MQRSASTAPRKPLLEIGGRTILEHTCAAFDAASSVEAVVLVGHADDLGTLEQLAARSSAMDKVARIVPGGAQRSDSVRLGVEAVAQLGGYELVAVHDAARALIRPQLIDLCLARTARHGAALVALPVHDTIKRSEDGRSAVETLDRSKLWAAQTPQAFRIEQLLQLFERALADGIQPTDDAALYERYVGPIPFVEGDPSNIKITTPEDLAVAEAILTTRRRGAGPRS